MIQTVDTINTKGETIGKIDLPEGVFGVEINEGLIALAVRVYLNNQRQGTSKAKTRGEVDRTTAKAYRQKGTGRARHGSKSAPIFVGGGVAHGPTGNQVYELKLNKKMRQAALLSALSLAAHERRIVVVDSLDSVSTNTKTIVSLTEPNKKVLLMLEAPHANIVRAGRNIVDLTITQAKRINTYEIMRAGKTVIHKPAIESLVATFSNSKENL